MLLDLEGRLLTGLGDIDANARRDFVLQHLSGEERGYLTDQGLTAHGRGLIHEARRRADADANWYSYREAARIIATLDRQEQPLAFTMAHIQRLRLYLDHYRPGFVDEGVLSYIQKLGETHERQM